LRLRFYREINRNKVSGQPWRAARGHPQKQRKFERTAA
jgi:hypothetical protein